jgi:hypothetical protein
MSWRRPGYLFGVGAWLLVIALAVWANVLPFALYPVAAAVLLALIRIGRGGTRQPWLKWITSGNAASDNACGRAAAGYLEQVVGT